MINSINMYTPSNNNAKRNSQNFGMAYRIDNRWSEMFSQSKELEFLSALKHKANMGAVKYISNDGLTYRFKCQDGDILFMKEQKGLMSNVKFVPNKSDKEGFYIINNGASGIDAQFRDMTRALNGVLKRDYMRTKPVARVLKHNPAYNAYARSRSKASVGYIYA